MSRIVEQLLAQRKRWLDIAPGQRVQIIRPPETDIGGLFVGSGKQRTMVMDLAQVIKYTVGWDGVTEASLLGAAIGASDPVPFSSDVWAVVVADRTDWVQTISAALLTDVLAHFEKKAQAEKNSQPSSTTAAESNTTVS